MEPAESRPLLRLDPRVFRQSQFWILTGLLSIGVAISSMSKRFTNMVGLVVALDAPRAAPGRRGALVPPGSSESPGARQHCG
jgi:hypothetical protein